MTMRGTPGYTSHNGTSPQSTNGAGTLQSVKPGSRRWFARARTSKPMTAPFFYNQRRRGNKRVAAVASRSSTAVDGRAERKAAAKGVRKLPERARVRKSLGGEPRDGSKDALVPKRSSDFLRLLRLKEGSGARLGINRFVLRLPRVSGGYEIRKTIGMSVERLRKLFAERGVNLQKKWIYPDPEYLNESYHDLVKWASKRKWRKPGEPRPRTKKLQRAIALRRVPKNRRKEALL
jgi:hypothetical protein